MLATILLFLGGAAHAGEEVTADSLWSWMAWPNAPIVVDVRELPEWQAGHIPQAMHYAWLTGDVKARWKELTQAGAVVLVDRSGERSPAAAEYLEGLKDSGFTAKVYVLEGGMGAWNHSVASSSPRRKTTATATKPLAWDILGRLRGASTR